VNATNKIIKEKMMYSEISKRKKMIWKKNLKERKKKAIYILILTLSNVCD